MAHSGHTSIGLVGSRLPPARIAGGAEDSAWHTLGECPEWANDRSSLREVFGRDLRVASVLRAAAASPSKWGAFLRFAKRVMTAKEVAERERQAAANAVALGGQAANV